MNRIRTTSKKHGEPSRPSVKRVPDGSLKTILLLTLGGFAVGVLWPRLAGVRLVPEAPIDEVAEAPPQEKSAPSAAATESPPQGQPPQSSVKIGEAEVTSCRDDEGKELKDCGQLDVDAILHEQLKRVDECKAAEGAFGTLSLGLEIDFSSKRVGALRLGKSTKLPRATADEILACLSKSLASVSPQAAGRVAQSYTVYYLLHFQAHSNSTSEVTPMSGQAWVEWRTALIRERAERGAPVVSRVLTGTKLLVTGRKGEWIRVKYDARGREGWVHGAAIGLADKPVP